MQRQTRSVAIVGGLLVGMGVFLYPIVIEPLVSENTRQQYCRVSGFLYFHQFTFIPVDSQREMRRSLKERNLTREDIQPGGMRVWTNPFDPPKGNAN